MTWPSDEDRTMPGTQTVLAVQARLRREAVELDERRATLASLPSTGTRADVLVAQELADVLDRLHDALEQLDSLDAYLAARERAQAPERHPNHLGRRPPVIEGDLKTVVTVTPATRAERDSGPQPYSPLAGYVRDPDTDSADALVTRVLLDDEEIEVTETTGEPQILRRPTLVPDPVITLPTPRRDLPRRPEDAPTDQVAGRRDVFEASYSDPRDVAARLRHRRATWWREGLDLFFGAATDDTSGDRGP